MHILQIVAPVFIIILLGYLARKYRMVRDDWAKLINNYIYYVALPALIALSFWNINWGTEGIAGALGWNFIFMLALAAITILTLAFTKLSKPMRASVFMAVMVGNTVYMGFPLMKSAVEESKYDIAVAVATLQLVLGLVFSVLAIESMVVRSKKIKIYLDDLIKNPLMISLFAGLILGLSGWSGKSAGILKSPLSMLGSTASPLALFALGVFMHGKFLKQHALAAGVVTGLRLVALPVVAFFALKLIGVPDYAVNISAVLYAMPVAVTTFVLSEKYELEKHFNASVIVLSTAVAVIVLPILLAVFA